MEYYCEYYPWYYFTYRFCLYKLSFEWETKIVTWDYEVYFEKVTGLSNPSSLEFSTLEVANFYLNFYLRGGACYQQLYPALDLRWFLWDLSNIVIIFEPYFATRGFGVDIHIYTFSKKKQQFHRNYCWAHWLLSSHIGYWLVLKLLIDNWYNQGPFRTKGLLESNYYSHWYQDILSIVNLML